MTRQTASIITIGDELLIGQVVDTNSAWMAQELNKAGILVHRRVAVGDHWDAIWNALDEESRRAGIVLITGGLGPTADDITKPLLCEYFGGTMILDAGALANVERIFTQILKRPMIERNRNQALVPDCCRVLQNAQGTAPGMWFEKGTGKDKTIFVSMPGVPFEMKYMMTHQVIPDLVATGEFPHIVHRTLLTAGVGESFLAEKISDFESALPSHIKLAYLPNYGMVRLRLSASGMNQEAIEQEVQQYFEQLQFRVHEFLVVAEDLSLQEVVGNLLRKRAQTLATVESCTGGYIAHLLTEKAGASEFYKGSVVAYSNEIKQSVLKVPASLLAEKGAVSEEVVQLMATQVRAQMNSDYSLAVSGIMGPGGATDEKPVGTVWMAVAGAGFTKTRQFQFRFDRQRNIQLTAVNVLNLLRECLLNEPSGNAAR